MLFLLDTNALSDFMQGNVAITSRLARLSAADAAVTCSIVLGEIAFGIRRLPAGKRRDRIAESAARALPLFKCFAVPEEAAERYATARLDTKQRGFNLNDNDLWIAATALTLGATLVTRDQDFSRVGGLTIEDWTA